ncbi:MAG: mechanosensitive ion channel family protein [Comamonas sp.]
MYSEMEPWAQAVTGLLVLVVIAVVSRFVAQGVLFHFVRLWRNSMPQGWAQILLHDHVLVRVAKIVPSVVVQLGVHWVQNLPATPYTAIRNAAAAFTIYHVVRAVTALLQEINEAHDRHDGPKVTKTNSIKSYVQLGKLIAYGLGALLIAATLMDRSPLLLLSGLGAMSAVLMLVFKDTILSFVAGVQLASNNMMRVGDWIEMPQVGADGFVVDIALHTVKVQNWDKTITTIPTWKLMSESFKNWRGMFESGGRRIRRSLNIDASTVHLLSAAQKRQLSQVGLLQNYWNEREGQLCVPNGGDPGLDTGCTPIASNQVTNLHAYKAYAYAYLMAHPRISKQAGMLLLVRTMQPTENGIPLELYCFTATTAWVEYEGIQGDVIDHLIGVLPQFGLALFQRSSDFGSRRVAQALSNTQ